MLAVFPLMVLPGTELWNKAETLKLNYEQEPPYFIRSHASMGEADVEYGWKMVGALKQLGSLRTIRLLSKETNVTLSEIIDEWINWRDKETESVPVQEIIPAFVLDFCEKRRIPTAFYHASAMLESGKTSYQTAV